MIDELTLGAVVFTIVEISKTAGLHSKYAPMLALILGAGFGFLSGLGLITGVIAGLTASGLYSGAKASSK